MPTELLPGELEANLAKLLETAALGNDQYAIVYGRQGGLAYELFDHSDGWWTVATQGE